MPYVLKFAHSKVPKLLLYSPYQAETHFWCLDAAIGCGEEAFWEIHTRLCLRCMVCICHKLLPSESALKCTSYPVCCTEVSLYKSLSRIRSHQCFRQTTAIQAVYMSAYITARDRLLQGVAVRGSSQPQNGGMNPARNEDTNDNL